MYIKYKQNLSKNSDESEYTATTNLIIGEKNIVNNSTSNSNND